MDDWSPLTVDKVVIRHDHEDQLVFLRQTGGPVVFPIAVGLYEAAAVKNALDNPVSPRPLTHELVYGVTKALGGRILHGVIESLLEGVFYAKIALVTSSGEQVELDCRPSDAICVAKDAGVPLYATRALLEKVSSG